MISFRRMIREKRENKKETVVEEIRNIHTESQLWQYKNKRRKQKQGLECNISTGEWKIYFAGLLSGSSEKWRGEARKPVMRDEDVADLNTEEIEAQMRKLKKEKGLEWTAYRMRPGKIVKARQEISFRTY